MDFCYETRLCIRNSIKYVHYVNMHLGHILYKYGWNQRLDNKAMNLYLTVSQRMRSTSQIILLYFQRGVVKCVFSTLFIKALVVTNIAIYLLSKSSLFK